MNRYGQIQNVLSKKGINTIDGNIYDLIAIWKEWYRGNVNDFHYYNLKLANGTTTRCELLTMNMPKKVCEDFSKLLWSEKVQINLNNEQAQSRLYEILDSKKNNFSVMFPQHIEKSFALGTGALVQYKVDDEIKIDYVLADTIIPYKYDNGNISGMLTMSTFTEGVNDKRKYYTHLTYHEFDGIKYIKYNELYKSTTATTLGKEIDFNTYFPEVQNPIEYETDTPHFQIIKPNIANNLDFDTPMGISVFANHIDKFKSIDSKYDSFNNEFKLGKKRILVDKTAIKKQIEVDPSTEEITYLSYFDENDTVYQAISGMEQQPVKEVDFSLRYQEHINSINADLNWLSAGVGLGQNFYSFDGQSMKTATEVVSENSDTYRAKVNHQIIIKDVLHDLVKSVLFLDGINTDDLEITIMFDDSIIEDKQTELKRGIELVNNGLMSKQKFLEKYMGYTEQQIIDELAKIQDENKIILPEAMDFFGNKE